MFEPRRTIRPILKEATEDQNLPKLQIEIQSDPKNLAKTELSPEEHYLQRKMEVTQRDHEEFVLYSLRRKRSRDEQKRAEQSEPVQVAPAPADIAGAAPSKLDRRSFLTVVAGTAAVGEAAALGHMIIKDQAIPSHGAKHAGDTYTEAQRHNIERELINPTNTISLRG